MTMNRRLSFKILEVVERQAAPSNPIIVEVDGYARAVVGEHVRLAREAGWLEAERSNADGGDWLVERLTYSGHQELAKMREELHTVGRG